MASVINTNLASLNAQRNLSGSQGALATSLQRLSSGLRINSAKDDAAGLAISERMTAQIRGMNQAARNANDGISLAQTAEGAMGEATNILQRIREMAVQAANATNSGTDRAALQQEVGQLRSELDRIATTTEFNGTKLLDGTFSAAQFQVGANANQTISVTVDGVRANQIGSVVNTAGTVAQTVAANVTGAASNGTAGALALTSYNGVDSTAIASLGQVKINGTDVKTSAAYDVTGGDGSSAYSKAAAINASNIAGVTATATNVVTIADNAGNFVAWDQGATGADSGTYTLSINGTQVFQQAFAGADTAVTVDTVVASINTMKDTTQVVASKDSNGDLVLTAADGRNIKVGENYAVTNGGAAGSNSAITSALSSFTQSADANGTYAFDATYRGKVSIQSSSAVTIDAGNAKLGFAGTLLSVDTSKTIANVDVSTVDNANAAILAVDAALTSINASRAKLGAVQSRFDSAISNLQATSENLNGARSRIRDTDFAAETASLTRGQILQQAGTAMLAQANSLPNGVLALLRG